MFKGIIIGVPIIVFVGFLFAPYNVDEPKQCITTPCDQFRTTSIFQEMFSVTRDEIPAGKCPGPRILVDGECVLPEIEERKQTVAENLESLYEIDVCKTEPNCFSATVKNVIDGDTLDVKHLTTGEPIRIRLSLVDTQELGEPLFDQSKRFTSNLCPVGSIVVVDQDDGQLNDRYGRFLGAVYCDGKLLNKELLNVGLGVIDYRFCDESEYSYDEWAQSYGCSYKEPQFTPSIQAQQPSCDPHYPTVCIPTYPPDLDCGEISHKRFEVLQPDPHRFDGDKDGIGCES